MRLLCQAAVLLGLMSVPGWSDPALYSNGGIDGGSTSYTPSFYSLDVNSSSPGSCGVFDSNGSAACGVFDTFTLSSDSVITGVSSIGLWVNHGDTVSSLSWYICQSICSDGDNNPQGVFASGTDVSSLNLSLVASDVTVGGTSYDVYSAGFAVSSLSLSAAGGPYTLELYDGIDNNDNVLWDVNGPGGASTAYQSIYGSAATCSDQSESEAFCSNSFEIDGTQGSTTPEPGTFWALGTGLFAISLLTRRRMEKRPGGK